MYLIHIKDILENKEYIYNTDKTKDFKNCITFLKNKLSKDHQKDLKYNIFENHCEIYYENEFKNKGWVWSSIETKRDIIYILTNIQILDLESNKLDKSSQTKKKLQKQTLNETQTQTGDNFINNRNHLSNYYSQIHNNNYNDYNNDYYYNNQIQIKPLNNHLSSGYAKNPIMPIWQDNLIAELEEKFSTLNFGLNSTNPNYF